MSYKRSVSDADVSGKRVIVRVDFNVPVKDGVVGDDTRIRAALPTINLLRERGARVVCMSHLGRPAGTGFEAAYSMEPVAARFSELLGAPVAYVRDVCGEEALAASLALADGEVLLVENLRFEKGEKKNDPAFAAALAKLGDVYVDDAFGVAHRAHASVAGVPAILPAYAGLLLAGEVDTITGMLNDPARPFVAVLGGSKVSDKIGVIDALSEKVDVLLIGGGMCFTFMQAQGLPIGSSRLPSAAAASSYRSTTSSPTSLPPTPPRRLLTRPPSPRAGWASTLARVPASCMRASSPAPRRSSGTAPWACSRWRLSPPVPAPWARPSPTTPRARASWVAATRPQPSRSSVSRAA